MPLDEIWSVPIAHEQVGQFVLADAGQNRRPGDLIAVQVKYGNHGAVARRIQALVGVPARGQRAGFRLAVSHHAASQQAGIVEHRAISMQQRVSQLAALVD